MRKNVRLFLMFLCLSIVVCGCSTKQEEKESLTTGTKDDEVILFEESISPNQDYVTSKDDIVNYTIQVSKDAKDTIVVKATSNSAFFTPLEYTVASDQAIAKENISVTWTTLMGDTTASEENQLGIAQVRITSSDEHMDERKINFVKGAMEIVTDTINQK